MFDTQIYESLGGAFQKDSPVCDFEAHPKLVELASRFEGPSKISMTISTSSGTLKDELETSVFQGRVAISSKRDMAGHGLTIERPNLEEMVIQTMLGLLKLLKLCKKKQRFLAKTSDQLL